MRGGVSLRGIERKQGKRLGELTNSSTLLNLPIAVNGRHQTESTYTHDSLGLGIAMPDSRRSGGRDKSPAHGCCEPANPRNSRSFSEPRCQPWRQGARNFCAAALYADTGVTTRCVSLTRRTTTGWPVAPPGR